MGNEIPSLYNYDGNHNGESLQKKDERKSTNNILEHRIDFNSDCQILSTTRLCFYCCEKGKEHPIEHFLQYPCCGHFLCIDCMQKNASFCGECFTPLPLGNNHAILWLNDESRVSLIQFTRERQAHLLGKVMVFGAHTFLDELLFMPVYRYEKLKPPSLLLATMNPPNVEMGVKLIEEAANHGIISAMLDLADIYCTNFANDPFEMDKKKAELWYLKALGKRNQISPLAFTHYGDFLKWEKRYEEARENYSIAATFGHARGQYEYAICILEGIGISRSSSDTHVSSAEEVEEAIQFLSKASTKGFYAPAYICLAKTLIQIAEKEYGTVYAVGKSPIPRVLQILTLCMECPYGSSQPLLDETSKLIKHYDKSKTRCSNCGVTGTQTHPLRFCGVCRNVAYCSNICQKRGYRDGHKFDCCTQVDLFNFQSIRLTLPWFTKSGWIRDGVKLARLSNSMGARSLMEMVEDETDEVYGEENQDYDEYVLRNLMLRMRQNLEIYLNREFQNHDNASNLHKQINAFSKRIHAYPGCQALIESMDTIRILGNKAAHSSNLECNKLAQVECENAVREYRFQKELFEKYKI